MLQGWSGNPPPQLVSNGHTAGTLLRPRFNQTKISAVKVNQRVEGKSKNPKASKALRTDKESRAQLTEILDRFCPHPEAVEEQRLLGE